MSLRFFNTLSGVKEDFVPVKTGEVKMYHCGPTVYDYAHIGNLRAYIFADTLRRTLEYGGNKVTQVINITDIGHLTLDADSGDDKMVKGLKREGLPLTLDGLEALADKYENAFKEDIVALNIEEPAHFPRATAYLKDEIELIKKLEESGYAYKTEDGIYFDTGKLEDYGKLGGLTPLDESRDRVESSNKKSPRDFVLWKFSEDDHLGFESPWGVGFPGWHIECSAMSRKLLGQPFDIHTGGIDHIPVHHNNEIAQSEAAYGLPLANFWLHNAFITTDGNKMAKSGGGFLTLRDVSSKGYSPISYRYFVLGAHYRSMLNFTDEALGASDNALKRLTNYFVGLGKESGKINNDYQKKFSELIGDDLDTPKALALVWELVKDEQIRGEDKKATLIEFDKVLGFNLEVRAAEVEKLLENIPIPVKNLLAEREIARTKNNFKHADELRGEILKFGFSVEDTPQGPRLFPL